MLDLNIIYISDLKKQMPYKDGRSIKAFLTKHKVEIFGGKGCKRSFIFKVQLERAQLQEKINCLIERFGNDWLRAFQTEMKIFAIHKAIIEEKQPEQETFITPPQKKPLGPQATKFLEDLHTI